VVIRQTKRRMLVRTACRTAASLATGLALCVFAAPSLTHFDELAAVPPGPTIGVLLADPHYLLSDYIAGVRIATLEVKWRLWEPAPNHTEAKYVLHMQQVARRYREAGYSLSVDVGLQYAPEWVLNLVNGQMRSQFGTLSGTADFVFNAQVRQLAASYIRDVVQALGPVSSYRIGLSEHGETLYPDASQGEWWAFSPIAQGRVSGLPPASRPSPLPGWIPGMQLWQGRTVTADEVRLWYQWYLGSLISAHTWEALAFRSAGFTGTLQLVMPGSGTNPLAYDERLANFLRASPRDGFETMNTGAVWFRVLELFPFREGIAVDVSSVYDLSGDPRGNACEVDDQMVDFTRDRSVDSWSSTRWLAYLGRRFGYNELVGESTGDNDYADMQPTFELADACGLREIYWAWDYQLHRSGLSPMQLNIAATMAVRCNAQDKK
jgi:hypothetical protein